MRVSVSWFSNSASPAAVVMRPRRTKTSVNPATNSAVSYAIRGSTFTSPSRTSPTDSPVMRLKYAGTIGKTHGDRNEMTPAPNAVNTYSGRVTSSAARSSSIAERRSYGSARRGLLRGRPSAAHDECDYPEHRHHQHCDDHPPG